jgi:hypothetical protein
MKTILVFLFSLAAFSQSEFRVNKTESFNIGVVVDPYASIKEHGLNIGLEIEYVGLVYTRASITSFTVLKHGYTDFIGAFGINFTSGMWEKFRYYTGGRLGLIRRASNMYPTAGLEAGIDYNINDKISLGLRTTYDKRTDFMIYNAPQVMRQSGFIKLGFKVK